MAQCVDDNSDALQHAGRAGAHPHHQILGLVARAAAHGAAKAASAAAGKSGAGNHGLPSQHPPTDPHDGVGLFVNLIVAVVLVLLGGAFAGLTIALMGQDETHLEVIATSGESLAERRAAGKVLGLLRMGKHWVLVSLLLSNVITNETLPIVLDSSLGGGWPAVLSSTIAIVIFGEIAPQSACVRWGLSIGAFMTPFVKILMWVLSPVAWPVAKLLDRLLGEDRGTVYKKAGLKKLVQLHKSLGTRKERLIDDEVTIINSALDLKEKTVFDVMTPIEDVFTLSADTLLDEKALANILSQGYSRIPIFRPGSDRNFQGMLLVKSLIGYDPHPETRKRIADLNLSPLPETSPATSCLDIINFFQQGKSHMVLVSHYPGQDRGGVGVVTLEDVMEELLGEEIIDESDIFIDVHRAIRRGTTTLPAKTITRAVAQAFSDEDPASKTTMSNNTNKTSFSGDNRLSKNSFSLGPESPGDVEMEALLPTRSASSERGAMPGNSFKGGDRSGSLTETTVLAGDMEKVVLQSSLLDPDPDEEDDFSRFRRRNRSGGGAGGGSDGGAASTSALDLEEVVIDV